MQAMVKAGTLARSPLRQMVAAVSVGIVQNAVLLDLAYEEDSQADVDMNVVMAADGELVEVQATGERSTFPRTGLATMLDVAAIGIQQMFSATQAMLDAER
jgi:ribonuclease PH